MRILTVCKLPIHLRVDLRNLNAVRNLCRELKQAEERRFPARGLRCHLPEQVCTVYLCFLQSRMYGVRLTLLHMCFLIVRLCDVTVTCRAQRYPAVRVCDVKITCWCISHRLRHSIFGQQISRILSTAKHVVIVASLSHRRVWIERDTVKVKCCGKNRVQWCF